ncbi:MAG: oxaloacetate decarboxylase gamma subunit [Halieaceae bacterium]|jgi:oxaloacetate decarboxylase gamma subunit
MQESLINQGVELMIFGMGTVFVFLVLLVLATLLLSYLVNAFGLADAEVDPLPQGQSPIVGNRRLVAVVTAALTLHRKRPR